MATKPVPRIDGTNAPFFAACNEEKVLIQRCRASNCRSYVYYPRVCCPVCRRGELEWTQVSGRGRLSTFTIVHRPHHPGFAAEAPYFFAAIELDEGPLLYGRLDHARDDPPAIGAAVEPVFMAHAPGQKLLGFRIARES